MMKTEVSQKWIKASIAGTIWAASEIVLGSFLHNLKIPFSGNILTAIGLVLLISISYTWTEKGLFWRAGLICAILKTMSPSAVIFGPMIAIFSESLLLEISVRLLGRTLAGYIIGSMLAMSWNLFQKIINYIIFYGSNIIEVYSDLLKLAQKQLNLQTEIVWLPIILLLIAYSLFGFIASAIGIRVGRKILKEPIPDQPDGKFISGLKVTKDTDHEFNYSVIWLLANILLIAISLILLSKASWIIWSLSIAVITGIWSIRYKRAIRQLLKPKFWLFFVFITLVTAFVFTKAQSGKDLLKEGLLTGFQMNFRAVVIIVGFSVLGTELYNPRIRNYFLKTSFKHLPLAIELSAEGLPSFIAAIPDLKSLIKNPVSVFYQVISNANKRLSEINSKPQIHQRIFIITGGIGEGKTTFTKGIIGVLNKHNIKVGGILSERITEGYQTIGYDINSIETNESEILMRQNNGSNMDRIGRFSIYPSGIQKGLAILSQASLSDKNIVVVDEVGALELNDKGWSVPVQEIIKSSNNHLLITVRDIYIDEVINKWDLKNALIFHIAGTDYLVAGNTIADQIKP